ncbi:hypothetical protein [Anaerocolumna jejuensis]|uniref:hypothetical protein n=1 Tax=Anaerocolumna jejuensis TaxID=259063 RepID=UPI003F7B6AF0
MMEIISQTNRTILLDLLTLVGEVIGIDSLSDDQMQESKEWEPCAREALAAEAKTILVD